MLRRHHVGPCAQPLGGLGGGIGFVPVKAASAVAISWTATSCGAARPLTAGSVGATGAPHAIIGQCFAQSGTGASSGQQGMAMLAAMSVSDDISTTPGASEAIGLAAATLPSGAATRPRTANAASAVWTTVSIRPTLPKWPRQHTAQPDTWLKRALKSS